MTLLSVLDDDDGNDDDNNLIQISYLILCFLKGYRAEMDNPSLSTLLPPSLRNKRDILFGNMPDLYNFHSRWGGHYSHQCNPTV